MMFNICFMFSGTHSLLGLHLVGGTKQTNVGKVALDIPSPRACKQSKVGEGALTSRQNKVVAKKLHSQPHLAPPSPSPSPSLSPYPPNALQLSPMTPFPVLGSGSRGVGVVVRHEDKGGHGWRQVGDVGGGEVLGAVSGRGGGDWDCCCCCCCWWGVPGGTGVDWRRVPRRRTKSMACRPKRGRDEVSGWGWSSGMGWDGQHRWGRDRRKAMREVEDSDPFSDVR